VPHALSQHRGCFWCLVVNQPGVSGFPPVLLARHDTTTTIRSPLTALSKDSASGILPNLTSPLENSAFIWSWLYLLPIPAFCRATAMTIL
jgi:hypothetical protein